MEGQKLTCEHGMEDDVDLLMEAHPNPLFRSHFPVRVGYMAQVWLKRRKRNSTGHHVSLPPAS